eukprot:607682_1
MTPGGLSDAHIPSEVLKCRVCQQVWPQDLTHLLIRAVRSADVFFMSNLQFSSVNRKRYINPQQQITIQCLYQSCDQLWRKKQYTESKNTCLKLLSINPAHSDAHNRLGTNYKALSSKPHAVKHFKLSIFCDKNNKTAYNNLANLYSTHKPTWCIAQQCYIKAIAIDPCYASSHANYGVLLRKLRLFEDAQYHYKYALKISPNNAWIHFNYGNLMKEEFQEYDIAEAHYKECVNIDDTYSEAYHNYAVLLHKRNELEEAQIYYEKTLQFDGDCVLTLRNLS